MSNYILKLPHYSCEENQLYFLNKKHCKVSNQAAALYQKLSCQLNLSDDYPEDVVDELIKTQAVLTCTLSDRCSPDAPLILVFSPHLDDAVFSIGGLLTRLSSEYRIHIVTLFSIDPYSIYKELKNDFERLQRLRSEEETVAASLIKATVHQMQWKDAMLRNYTDFREPIHDEEPINQYIKDLSNETLEQPSLILCPLGIVHVDHRLTRIIADKVYEIKYIKHIPIMYYEDLPYACDDFTEPQSYKINNVKLSDYEIGCKKKMVKAYVSQLSPGLTSRILNYRKGQERLWYRENACKTDRVNHVFDDSAMTK